MESFRRFIESDDLENQPTRVAGSNQNNAMTALKQSNINAAKELLDQSPQILLHQVIEFDKLNPNEVSHMIDFARKHDFDDTMPLHSLLAVYERFAK